MRSSTPWIGTALALLLLSLGLPWGVVGAEWHHVPGWFNPGTCVTTADGDMDCTPGFASPGYRLLGRRAPVAGYTSDARVVLVAAVGLRLLAFYRRIVPAGNAPSTVAKPAAVATPSTVTEPSTVASATAVPGHVALDWAIVLLSAAILLTGSALRPGAVAAILAVALLFPASSIPRRLRECRKGSTGAAYGAG